MPGFVLGHYLYMGKTDPDRLFQFGWSIGTVEGSRHYSRIYKTLRLGQRLGRVVSEETLNVVVGQKHCL